MAILQEEFSHNPGHPPPATYCPDPGSLFVVTFARGLLGNDAHFSGNSPD
jgi:hypothetical protein